MTGASKAIVAVYLPFLCFLFSAHLYMYILKDISPFSCRTKVENTSSDAEDDKRSGEEDDKEGGVCYGKVDETECNCRQSETRGGRRRRKEEG